MVGFEICVALRARKDQAECGGGDGCKRFRGRRRGELCNLLGVCVRKMLRMDLKTDLRTDSRD